MDLRPMARTPTGARAGARSQGAGVLFFRRVDDFERLVRIWNRRAQREEIPLVFGLPLCLDREGVGFLNQLMIPRAEITLAAFEDVELRLLFQVSDQLLAVGRLNLVHRLRHDLERDVFDPRMVLWRFAMLFSEGGDKGF